MSPNVARCPLGGKITLRWRGALRWERARGFRGHQDLRVLESVTPAEVREGEHVGSSRGEARGAPGGGVGVVLGAWSLVRTSAFTLSKMGS